MKGLQTLKNNTFGGSKLTKKEKNKKKSCFCNSSKMLKFFMKFKQQNMESYLLSPLIYAEVKPKSIFLGI